MICSALKAWRRLSVKRLAVSVPRFLIVKRTSPSSNDMQEYCDESEPAVSGLNEEISSLRPETAGSDSSQYSCISFDDGLVLLTIKNLGTETARRFTDSRRHAFSALQIIAPADDAQLVFRIPSRADFVALTFV